jgi:photosystem II stability/assembly factor-like uncharacterized protein
MSMQRRATVLACLAWLGAVTASGAATNQWSAVGPPGGRATDMALDPAAPSTVYAVVDGWLYRTTDGGATWTPRATGLPVPQVDSEIVVQQVLVDRADPNVLNAIAGWFLFRSVDGGATWVAQPNPAGGAASLNVGSFLTNDPVTPGRCYLAFGEGVLQMFVSDDGGGHWAPLGVPPVPGYLSALTAFAIDPLSPATFYAYVSGRLYVSTNQGSSWTPAGAGLPVGSPLGRLLVAPTVPTTLYLYVGALYRSTDAGATWTQAGLGRTDVIPRALDPGDPLTLYATQEYAGIAAGPLFKTTDGGASWTPLDRHAPGTSDQGTIVDLAVDPSDGSRLWAATANGVLTSADGGGSWTITTAGQAAVGGGRVQSFVLVPPPSSTVYAIGSTLWRSIDGGASWSAHTPEPPVSFKTFERLSLVIDPLAPSVQYLGSSQRGAFKSTDGGDTWTPANAGLTDLRVYSLAIDPITPTVLYAATQGGLMRSTDGAASWSLQNALVTGQVLLDPQTPSTIYAGLGLYKSTDGGTSFSTPALVAGLVTNPFFGFPGLTFLALAPSLPSTLYLGFSAVLTTSYPPPQYQAIYRSVDGLDTGTVAQPFGPSTLAVDPSDAATVYIGFNRGVRSRDGGSTLTAFDAGLPGVVGSLNGGEVLAFGIAPAGDTVYLATQQTGTYRIDLPACAADADCDDGDDCTTDACVASRCEHANMPNGTPCTAMAESQECGLGATCSVGICYGSSCDDGDSCTSDLCAVGGACLHFDRCGTSTTTAPGSTTTTTSIAATTTTVVTTTTTVAGTSTTTTLPARLAGRLLSLRVRAGGTARKQMRAVSRDALVDLGRGDGSPDDPVLHGATIRVASAGAFDTTYVLVGSWRYLGAPGENRGYRWRSRDALVTSVVVRPGSLLRVVGRGGGLGYDLGSDPDPVGVVLGLGERTSCMLFGGTTKFAVNRSYLATLAPAPAACP